MRLRAKSNTVSLVGRRVALPPSCSTCDEWCMVLWYEYQCIILGLVMLDPTCRSK